MDQFSTQRAFIDRLAELLRRQTPPYAGAKLRVAFARRDRLQFATACVLFCEHQTPSRQPQDYGFLVMMEEWVGGQEDALNRLSELVTGRGCVEGNKVEDKFSRSELDREMYLGLTGRSGWRFLSHMDKAPGSSELYLPQDPVLSPGLKPYLGAFGAINRWIFDVQSPTQIGNQAPFHESIVTLLPETRVRLTSALWLPGSLQLDLDLQTGSGEMELQLVYEGSDKESDIVILQHGSMEIPIPEDARKLNMFVVDGHRSCLATLDLAPYGSYGKARKVLGATQQYAKDLENGENDTVEYKPFMSPHEPKENEFVETVVAFANASGGRIYLGVSDRDGTPQGKGELRKHFGKDGDPLSAQAARLKSLVRERIKPVPVVTIRPSEIHGEPLLVAEVEVGNDKPYSTHDNKAYIRKGATNRLADPRTEIPQLKPNSLFPTIFG
jgi:hypothetical protein